MTMAMSQKEREGDMISAAFPYRKQRRRVLGREMAYGEERCAQAVPEG
jgi:hypothetical protein